MKASIITGAVLLAAALLSILFFTVDDVANQSSTIESSSLDTSTSDPDKKTDWSLVTAISNSFRPRFADLHGKLADVLPALARASSYEDTQVIYEDIFKIQKAIRDLEREMWPELSEVMAYSELMDYQMRHSRDGREIIKNTKWFNPTKDELMCLYVAKKRYHEFLDDNYGGNIADMNRMIMKAKDRIFAVTSNPEISLRERVRIQDKLEGRDIDALNAEREYLSYISSRFTPERHREYNDRDGHGTILENHYANKPSSEMVAFKQMTEEEYVKAVEEWNAELERITDNRMNWDGNEDGSKSSLRDIPYMSYETIVLEEEEPF